MSAVTIRAKTAKLGRLAKRKARATFDGLRFASACAVLGAGATLSQAAIASAPKKPPNIVMIVLDDLNDWIGPLDGHPFVQTPHMDRLAQDGVVFTNAHVQAPLCNPSRASFLTGLRPTSTGIYSLAPQFRESDRLRDHPTFIQLLRNAGYRTEIYGKIFHDGSGLARDGSEVEVFGDPRQFGPLPERKLVPGLPHRLLDWGIYPEDDSAQFDGLIAADAIAALQSNDPRPFFVAVGLRHPHVPLFASRRWFDLYPDNDSILPKVLESDRADIPRHAWYLHWKLPEPRLSWVQAQGQFRNKVRSYLASISYADALVGDVIDAVEQNARADNTIILLISDHGYHLGEKGITGKNTLWEESTRVPMIWAGPGIPRSARIAEAVELLDIYPTLAELVEVGMPAQVEGLALSGFFIDPAASRSRPAITTHGPGNHSVRDERYRYIRYADGSEEFYDLAHDPHEWTNLADQPVYLAVKHELARWIPSVNAPPVKGSRHRLAEYVDGQAFWESEPIDPLAAPPTP